MDKEQLSKELKEAEKEKRTLSRHIEWLTVRGLECKTEEEFKTINDKIEEDTAALVKNASRIMRLRATIAGFGTPGM